MRAELLSHSSTPLLIAVPDPRVFDRNDDGAVDARDVLQSLPKPKPASVEQPKEKEQKAPEVEKKDEETHIDVIA